VSFLLKKDALQKLMDLEEIKVQMGKKEGFGADGKNENHQRSLNSMVWKVHRKVRERYHESNHTIPLGGFPT